MLFLIPFLYCFQLISCYNDIETNEISDDYKFLKYRTPDEESGKIVETWNENSHINPEELGNYFEGDILVPPTKTRNGLRDEVYRWKNGVIPYEIKGRFSSDAMGMIKKAMSIYHKYTCIKFIERKSSDQDYISITSGNTGCWSSVGRVEGRQEVNLQSPACTTKIGTIMHELMHVCGFYHEQNRPERDDYVTVNFQNIKPGHDANFIKAKKDSTTDFNVPYDFRSVMHYSEYAFSRNGKPTIVPKNSEAAGKIGQRSGFSRRDIQKLNSMYNCPNTLPEITTLPPEENNNNNGGGGGISVGTDLLSLLFPLFEE